MMNLHLRQPLTCTSLGILVLSIAACSRQPTIEVPLTTPTYADSKTTTAARSGSSITAEHLVELIEDHPSLQTLAAAIDKADLEDTLEEGGPYTIFAPSDRAFAALPLDVRARLLQANNRGLLRQILTYHVISGQIYANQLQSGEMATEAGSYLNVDVDRARVKVNEAQIVESDLQAANGVVHIVDRIILPPNFKLNPDRVRGRSQIANAL
ncbi:fasciclin domain-containing protein [Chamaesiphon sp. VAR_69_metabat_338]|uniref:fasciclin domain-containing protein n=1 Tax=Chamaesiphon sp. VAR_69_metabat_338 TaxID=2964704 RepID=UPI00286DF9D5|nr:fasciclin domain-containing protein [Chamaesiphon sp. VAR_69_metabat_338]